MSTYYLSCCILPTHKEPVIGSWSLLGMLGCQEDESKDGLVLTCYFPDEVSLRRAVYETMRNALLFSPISTGKVQDQDWNAQWRETMEPVKISPTLWVSPTWLTPPLKSGEEWIRVEPKMAFGTGHHESTRLAVAAMEDFPESLKHKNVLDIGTGSGVLCFAARLMGARVCVGVEIDSACAENLNENLGENPGEGRIEFIVGTIDSLGKRARFDAVVMNVILTQGEPALGSAVTHLRERGYLAWSGLLNDDRDRAVSAAQKYGLYVVNEHAENEWVSVTFQKQSASGAPADGSGD